MFEGMKDMVGIMKWIGRSGVFALRPKITPTGHVSKLTDRTAEMIRAMIASSKSHVETTIAEALSIIAAETQPVSTLGVLPLTVISHGQLDANAVPSSLGQEIREEYEHAWQEFQKEITSLSTCGRRIVVESSGHNIIFDQPKIVIESILEMVKSTSNRIGVPYKDAALVE